MGINVYWKNPGVLVIAYHDPWTWSDFSQAMQHMERLTAENHPLGIITDLRHSRSLPADALSYLNTIAEAVANDETGALFVVVDMQGVWRSVSSIFAVSYPSLTEKVRQVGSMEEAEKLIRPARI